MISTEATLQEKKAKTTSLLQRGGNKTNDFRAAAADVIQVRVAATVFKFEHGDCTTRSRRREKDGELAFNLKAEIVHNMQNVCVSSIERFQARLVVLRMQ
ncbi:hypothetical protein WN944_014998 [Citrus x changshan-huyou]|uniref:Uncharacterized protein n=2 Tax=Citrus TaxID=2706 RepID=A0AAP0QM87_9ROSI